MTKPELVKIVQASLAEHDVEATKRLSEDVLEAFCDALHKAIVTDGKVSLQGVGRFEIKETSARKGHNPRTGEPIDIPASKRIFFKACGSLKEEVKDL